ncbi:TPA_asm: hypothetical protein [Microviridae sp.]|nr:TPA_asm: hypothetical protein [Microviridae sp.]
MPRTKQIPTNSDMYRRCIAELNSIAYIDICNSGAKKLGVSPERYADLVGTLIMGTAYQRFLDVMQEYFREGDNSELARLATLVVPVRNGPDQPELFPSEADSKPASPKPKAAA